MAASRTPVTTTGNTVQDQFLEALREDLDASPRVEPTKVGYASSEIYIGTQDDVQTLIVVQFVSIDGDPPNSFLLGVNDRWSPTVLPIAMATAQRLRGEGVPIGHLYTKFA